MRYATLAAIVLVAGCGGEEGTQTSAIETPPWMLTIVSPRHGSEVGEEAEVEVALTGKGVALDLPRSFQVGYFIDDELVLYSADRKVKVAVPVGGHLLRVAGVDEAGAELGEVTGDRIQLVRLKSGGSGDAAQEP